MSEEDIFGGAGKGAGIAAVNAGGTAAVANLRYGAALIAGGRSRRMGTDKAFLFWDGRPLWEHQVEKLRALRPDQLLLSCRIDQPFPPFPDISPVYDEWPDSGPLGGVASCLRACRSPLLLVLGIDLPMLPLDLLASLLAACTADSGAVIVQGSGDDAYFEPMAAVYPVTTLTVAEEHITAGRLSMQAFIRRGVELGLISASTAPQQAAEWFKNMNTPEDLVHVRG